MINGDKRHRHNDCDNLLLSRRSRKNRLPSSIENSWAKKTERFLLVQRFCTFVVVGKVLLRRLRRMLGGGLGWATNLREIYPPHRRFLWYRIRDSRIGRMSSRVFWH
jgi:hypothetical protein